MGRSAVSITLAWKYELWKADRGKLTMQRTRAMSSRVNIGCRTGRSDSSELSITWAGLTSTGTKELITAALSYREACAEVALLQFIDELRRGSCSTYHLPTTS
jgi:hypothetical protein